MRFAHIDGDHLTLLNVYHAFKQSKSPFKFISSQMNIPPDFSDYNGENSFISFFRQRRYKLVL